MNFAGYMAPSSTSAKHTGDARARTVRVVSKTDETADVYTLELELVDGAPLGHQSGQYVDLLIEIDGEPVNRPYSVTSAANASKRFSLGIKREVHGLVSNYLDRELNPGNEISVRGPYGDFTPPRSRRPLVLVGAGVGITPLLSVVRTASQARDRRPLHLHCAYRRPDDALFLDELLELIAKLPRATLTSWWSREAPAGAEVARLTTGRLLTGLRAPQRAEYMLCGPASLMAELRSGLLAAGVPARRIRSEAFEPEPLAVDLGGIFPIRFASSGMEVESLPGESVLDVARRVGVPIDFSCRSGSCHLCAIELLAGEADLLPSDWADSAAARGEILACRCYPRAGCAVDA